MAHKDLTKLNDNQVYILCISIIIKLFTALLLFSLHLNTLNYTIINLAETKILIKTKAYLPPEVLYQYSGSILLR